MASAHRNQTLDPGTVWIGEVGLGGEIRSVGGLSMRLAEAAQLGFKRAVVPQTNLREAGRELHSLKLDIQGIRWLSEALQEFPGAGNERITFMTLWFFRLDGRHLVSGHRLVQSVVGLARHRRRRCRRALRDRGRDLYGTCAARAPALRRSGRRTGVYFRRAHQRSRHARE